MCKKAKFGKSKVTKSLLLNIQTKTFILLYFSNFHSFSYYFVAQTEEIIAMKMDVVQRGARKKYFWDLHELLPQYPLHLMLSLHQQRYPYTHDEKLILQNLTNFDLADDDFVLIACEVNIGNSSRRILLMQ